MKQTERTQKNTPLPAVAECALLVHVRFPAHFLFVLLTIQISFSLSPPFAIRTHHRGLSRQRIINVLF